MSDTLIAKSAPCWLALSFLLTACQPGTLPMTSPASSQPVTARPFTVPLLPKGAAQPAMSPAKAELGNFSARLESNGDQDRIVFKLPARKGFSTQAAIGGAGDELAYLRIWVDGPGIANPVYNSGGFIDVSGGIPAEVVVDNVPKGKNRVLVAQFYDASQNALDYAAAMSVYNSSTGSTGLSIRRQFLPLGRVILRLKQIAPLLAVNLDTAVLKTLLNPVLYGANTLDGNTYDIDPALINAVALAQAIFSAQGNLAGIDFNSASFKTQLSSLSLNVSEIAASDQITVSVGDPFSQPVTIGSDGLVTESGVAPGSWPIIVSTDKGTAYPTATLNGNSTPLSLSGGTVQAVVGTRSFVSNQVTSGGNLVLETNLDLDPLAVSFSRSGRALNFTGEGFNPTPSGNTVTFTHSVTAANTNASTFNSGDFEHLNVNVPSLPAGIYSVSVNGVNAGNLVVNVWTVTPTGSNSNEGLGWSDATSLALAMAQCAAGDEIWLKAGTYKPDPSSQAAYFQTIRTVTLRGGFNGVAIDGSRDPQVNPVILSGDLNNDDAAGVPIAADSSRDDNSYHVLIIGVDTTLDGLTIRGGYAVNPNPNSPLGSGLLMGGTGQTLTLNEVVFDRNYSANAGGAVYVGSGNTVIGTDVSFTQNRGEGPGGGAYINGSTVTLSDFTFSGNQTQNNGGGIAIEGGTSLTLTAGQFQGNGASNDTEGGGGAYVYNTPYTMAQLAFTNNTTPGGGAGLALLSSSGTVDASHFTGNQAVIGGGIVVYPSVTSDTSSLTVTRSSFFNNTGSSVGGAGQSGAIDSTSSSLALINSVFVGNSSDNVAGAVVAQSGFSIPASFSVKHCTFYNNDAKHGVDAGSSGLGDTLFIWDIDNYQIDNTVIWDDESFPHNNEVYAPGSTPVRVINNSVIMDLAALSLTGNTNNIDDDPDFTNPGTPAGGNGIFGDSNDGLQLLAGSPAINRGVAVGVPLDFIGLPRVLQPDAGAYEFHP